MTATILTIMMIGIPTIMHYNDGYDIDYYDDCYTDYYALL